ncbi:DUF862-domain-containing protein [Hortaea werneckii]|uniref:PPPDE domain-containing protein n=2 Tax=Hortaea werneckii TaxID=91943 RepID=A0A3M7IX48_HORWE|nr:DUF862-domain-containing protein [Hortaea werneckii]KAI7044354.1 DUF862-domain-containing protein [Hortaea werneckii]KAI7077000.1 DUF862-domain-containing protein [Hortaea werneckii]KAI7134573.1 DUF862-domain-containing protein [Hortaea werneckii]KAI7271610.1 DUF862-domain-containing protein [Hortaea werneckii]
MEVQLYVYDLTHGMARQMSQQLLGFKIDAVYHTSLVFNGIEYFFGAGVQTCYAGTTHHGRPMEIESLGTTHLPMETILEYLESLKQIYTPESYDLFAHNCNNFTNDFAMFLVGRGIPDHITSLPKRVLDTPFGQMLKPQIDASMRTVTQAPVPPENIPVANGTTNNAKPKQTPVQNGSSPQKATRFGQVVNLTDVASLDKKLQEAGDTASTIFFTSSTCAPCKLAYPTYDQLSEEYSNALFVRVDINAARDIAAKYQIRATPTFMSFSKGSKVDEWTGADPRTLKTNVERTMQQTFPPHPHAQLRLPTLQYGSLKPVSYGKIPPLDKLMTKLGDAGQDEALTSLRTFVQKRSIDPREAALPNLETIGSAFRTRVLDLPLSIRFAAVDLLRCALIDPRVSGFFAEEAQQQQQQQQERNQHPSTLTTLLTHINDLGTGCPHNLRLVTLHLACNLFTSPPSLLLLPQPAGSNPTNNNNNNNTLLPPLIDLTTSSLLDPTHGSPTSTRVAASWLAYNLSVSNYIHRRERGGEGQELLSASQQVELAAAVVETLGSAEEKEGEEKEEGNAEEAVKGQVLALGYLLFFAPTMGDEGGGGGGGEVGELCRALDAQGVIVKACQGKKRLEGLGREVGGLI